MDAFTIIFYVLVHVAFVVWATFAVWYGIWRKWEDTEHGRNAFTVSIALTIAFFVMISGIWWKDELPRTVLVLIAVGILTGVGIQRLTWLWDTRKRKQVK